MLNNAFVRKLSLAFVFFPFLNIFSQVIDEIKLDATQDSYVYKKVSFFSFSSPKGHLSKVKLSSQPSKEENCLIQFNVTPNILPSGSKLLTAKIQLHGTAQWQGDWQPTEIRVHNIKSTWNENTVIWKNFGSNDYTTQFTSAYKVPNQADWDIKNVVEFDVTNDVSNIIEHNATNKGWFFTLVGGKRKIHFISSNNQNKEFRPKLVITYESPKKEPITIKTVGQEDVTVFGGNDGMAKIQPKGGSGSYTYLWTSSNGNTVEFEDGKQEHIKNLTAGIYTVVVFDASNSSVFCNHSITITQPDSKPITIETIEQKNVSSYKGKDGSATLIIKSGFAPGGDVTLTWNPEPEKIDYFNDEGKLVIDLKKLTAQNYILTIKRASDNSEVTHDLIITQPNPLNPIVVIKSTHQNLSYLGANDGFVSISSSGGSGNYEYNWSPEPFKGQGTNTISGLTAGTYTLTVTDASNSSINKELIVEITENEQQDNEHPGGVLISKKLQAKCDPSSILDIQSTDKGVLIPRMTAYHRDQIKDPANGLLVYVTDDNNFYYRKGIEWIEIGSGNTSSSSNITETMTLQPSTTIPSNPKIGEMFLHDTSGNGDYTLKIWLGGVNWKIIKTYAEMN